MKKTKSESKIKLAKQFKRVREQKKEITALEKELKTKIEGILGDDGAMDFGDFVIITEDRSRTVIDTDAILRDHGEAFLKQYQVKSHYSTLKVAKGRKAA